MTWDQLLLTYGPLGAFALAAWRIAVYLGHRLFDAPTDDSPGGLVTRYFDDHAAFLRAATESQKAQQDLCRRHASGIEQLTAVCANAGQTLNTHDERTRKALTTWCDLCTLVARKEFPESAPDVERHCSEIKRHIGL